MIGPVFVTERAAGREWRVSAAWFWQVHPAAADTLAACVVDMLAPGAGETALDWARKFGDRDVISILTAEGAAPGSRVGAAGVRAVGIGATEVRGAGVAVESAVGLLQRSANEFFRQSGCVGCHHQTIAVMASAAFSLGDRVADLTVLGSNAPYRHPARGPRLRNLGSPSRPCRDCSACPAQCRAGLDGLPTRCRPLGAAPLNHQRHHRRGSLRSHLARPYCNFRHLTRRLGLGHYLS